MFGKRSLIVEGKSCFLQFPARISAEVSVPCCIFGLPLRYHFYFRLFKAPRLAGLKNKNKNKAESIKSFVFLGEKFFGSTSRLTFLDVRRALSWNRTRPWPRSDGVENFRNETRKGGVSSQAGWTPKTWIGRSRDRIPVSVIFFSLQNSFTLFSLHPGQVFCSTSLPLTSTRWVQSTIQLFALSTLFRQCRCW